MKMYVQRYHQNVRNLCSNQLINSPFLLLTYPMQKIVHPIFDLLQKEVISHA